MLLETSLQWIEWLHSAEMSHKDVERCPQKFQSIMCLMKRISGRTRGMGLKTTKFHCILHMPEDMMACGVPMEVDTRCNEMHHKPSKKAAALTQKDKSKFEEQIHARLEEVHLLELGAEEMEGRGVMHCSIAEATLLIPNTPLSRPTRPVEGALLSTRTPRVDTILCTIQPTRAADWATHMWKLT